jgi:serine/threonine protein phosphatase 1
MVGRTIAIGDVHGCLAALDALLAAIDLRPEDTLVTLGDYVDRGPDSRGVVERLLQLAKRCRLIPLSGNHESMMAEALANQPGGLRRWLVNGGADTLRSYGWTRGGPRRAVADWIPPPHQAFVTGCRLFHETATHLFVHAGYEPDLPLVQQPELILRWRVTDARRAVPHCSGKVAVVGHTPQASGEVLDLGFLLCLDTNCVRGGWLTARDVVTGETWQADGTGRLRSR